MAAERIESALGATDEQLLTTLHGADPESLASELARGVLAVRLTNQTRRLRRWTMVMALATVLMAAATTYLASQPEGNESASQPLPWDRAGFIDECSNLQPDPLVCTVQANNIEHAYGTVETEYLLCARRAFLGFIVDINVTSVDVATAEAVRDELLAECSP